MRSNEENVQAVAVGSVRVCACFTSLNEQTTLCLCSTAKLQIYLANVSNFAV